MSKIKRREYLKHWKENNKEKCLTYTKKWKQNNKDKVADSFRRWRKRHPDKAKANSDKWVANNKEKRAEYVKRYRQSPKYRYSKYKTSAKTRGYEFLLTLEQFSNLISDSCYYCGTNICKIGIDRKDNNKGYIIDNCISCCWDCNKFKGILDYESFIRHIEKISTNLFFRE